MLVARSWLWVKILVSKSRSKSWLWVKIFTLSQDLGSKSDQQFFKFTNSDHGWSWSTM